VLTDEDLSESMPETFAAPPEIISGFMAKEAEDALLRWNPVIAGAMKVKGLFVVRPLTTVGATRARRTVRERAMRFLRRTVFDRFGR